MDRFSPPSLIVPVVLSLFAAIFLSLGYNMPPNSVIRTLFVAIGVVLSGAALFTGADWLIWKLGDHIKRLRESWYAPVLSLATAISIMNREQLALMGAVSPFRVEGRLSVNGVQWWLHTIQGDIPYGWISGYLEKCALSYPQFEPQHGYSDTLNRDYIQWFTGLMVSNNMAERSVGNRPARWTVPLDVVYQRLGLDEGPPGPPPPSSV